VIPVIPVTLARAIHPPGSITKIGSLSPKSRAFERYNALTSNRDRLRRIGHLGEFGQVRCPSCQYDNPEATKFCGNCGAPLNHRCTKCGRDNPSQFKFCGECGAQLQAGSASAAPTAAGAATPSLTHLAEQPSIETQDVPEGERKTVTALFADIKGSTELMADLDPEQARTIIDPALKLMIDAVHRYDGDIVQSTGEGIFALFGAPIAHEDHPQRALRLAV
jgi:hypothetical protein